MQAAARFLPGGFFFSTGIVAHVTSYKEQDNLRELSAVGAASTATACGSLGSPVAPGFSSMGKLIACTLAAVALFRPALIGKLRTVAHM
jgi:hypothetical protein